MAACKKPSGVNHHAFGKKRPKEIVDKTSEKTRVPVMKCDKEGNVLQEYQSAIFGAADVNGKAANISACCYGKQRTAYGYTWRFKDDTRKSLFIKPERVIFKYTKKGKFVGVVASARQEAKAQGVVVSRIHHCIRTKMPINGFIYAKSVAGIENHKRQMILSL